MKLPYGYKVATVILLAPWFGNIIIEKRSFKPIKEYVYDSQGDWRQVLDLFGVLPILYTVAFLSVAFSSPSLDRWHKTHID